MVGRGPIGSVRDIVVVLAATFLISPAAIAAGGKEAVTTDGLACSSFTWVASKETPFAGMVVPVSINGRPYSFQLDTGADVFITYGKKPHPDWRPEGKTLRVPNVRFAGATFPAVVAYPYPNMSDEDQQGTVGLDLLIGHTLVIDFPKRRVCLLDRATLPAALEEAAKWTPAEVRHGHFYLTAELAGMKLDGLVYDTGSSAASLDVDLATWKRVTGRSEAEGVGPTIEQHAWGKTLHQIEAPARGNLVLGEETFDAPLVSTIVERPDYYRDQLWGQGVIGNALLLHDIVILDLGAHPAVGLIPSATGARAQADK